MRPRHPTDAVPPLTAMQQREILRFRRIGKEFKWIAKLLKCTPNQARYWWLKNNTQNYDAIHRAQARKCARLARMRKRLERERIKAAEVLKAEVKLGAREIATNWSKPFKSGELEW